MNSDLEASYLLLALLACKAVGLRLRGWNGGRWAAEQIAHLFPGMRAVVPSLERANVVDGLRTLEDTKLRLNRKEQVLGRALDLDIARLEVLRLIKGGE